MNLGFPLLKREPRFEGDPEDQGEFCSERSGQLCRESVGAVHGGGSAGSGQNLLRVGGTLLETHHHYNNCVLRIW